MALNMLRMDHQKSLTWVGKKKIECTLQKIHEEAVKSESPAFSLTQGAVLLIVLLPA